MLFLIPGLVANGHGEWHEEPLPLKNLKDCGVWVGLELNAHFVETKVQHVLGKENFDFGTKSSPQKGFQMLILGGWLQAVPKELHFKFERPGWQGHLNHFP